MAYLKEFHEGKQTKKIKILDKCVMDELGMIADIPFGDKTLY